MLRKLFAKYEQNGPIGVFLAILRHLPGISIVCMYYVYRLPLSKLKDESSPSDTFRFEILDDDSYMEHLLTIQDKPDIYIDRFRKNHFCIIAYVANEPVAYLWCQIEGVHCEQRYRIEIPIEDNQAYYYDSYTILEWRKKGLLKCLIQRLSQYILNNFHKDELSAIIEFENIVSQKAHEKIGFIRDRLELFLTILGKSFQFHIKSYQIPEA